MRTLVIAGFGLLAGLVTGLIVQELLAAAVIDDGPVAASTGLALLMGLVWPACVPTSSNSQGILPPPDGGAGRRRGRGRRVRR